MRCVRLFAAALLIAGLSGCLEIEQHPPWVHGYYDGKADNLPSERHYHGDRLAWTAAIDNRNRRQNEYSRMP